MGSQAHPDGQVTRDTESMLGRWPPTFPFFYKLRTAVSAVAPRHGGGGAGSRSPVGAETRGRHGTRTRASRHADQGGARLRGARPCGLSPGLGVWQIQFPLSETFWGSSPRTPSVTPRMRGPAAGPAALGDAQRRGA